MLLPPHVLFMLFSKRIFLFVTCVLAAVAWVVAIVSQSFAFVTVGNSAVGVLWFAAILQLFLNLAVVYSTVCLKTISIYRMQIACLASMATVLAIIGVERNMFWGLLERSLTALGWLALAIIDIFWVLYFSSEKESPLLRFLGHFDLTDDFGNPIQHSADQMSDQKDNAGSTNSSLPLVNSLGYMQYRAKYADSRDSRDSTNSATRATSPPRIPPRNPRRSFSNLSSTPTMSSILERTHTHRASNPDIGTSTSGMAFPTMIDSESSWDRSYSTRFALNDPCSHRVQNEPRRVGSARKPRRGSLPNLRITPFLSNIIPPSSMSNPPTPLGRSEPLTPNSSSTVWWHRNQYH